MTANLMTEVERFRQWADTQFLGHRSGEWECDYDWWGDLYNALLNFVGTRPYTSWNAEELQAVLYALARDNEMQHLAKEIRKRHPELLPLLSDAAIQGGEWEARWQLAEELGHLDRNKEEAEQLLLRMVRDEYEYVRRRSLASLMRIRSSAVEQLALEAWNRPDEAQEWSRMMALECLYEIGSSRSEPLLIEAERDERQYLRNYAEGIRSRNITD